MKNKKVTEFEIGKCYQFAKPNFTETIAIIEAFNNEFYGIIIKEWISTKEMTISTIIYHKPEELKEISKELFLKRKNDFLDDLNVYSK